MKQVDLNTDLIIDYQKAINACINALRNININFAFWKEPKSSEINLIVDFNQTNLISDIDLETSESGFLFAPFNNSKEKVFIKRELHIQWNSDAISVNCEGKSSESFIEYLHNFEDTEYNEFHLRPDTETSDNYKSLVEESVNEIKAGKLVKVVPSRSRKITFDGRFNYGQYFNQLVSNYPTAFISLTYTSKSGIWIGATPELLIQVENDIFKTVSLAGTQSFNENQTLADTAWTQKEIEEQALVSRYIINCFKKIRLREFDEHGPKTVKAGNLIHLKTEFTVNMKETNFPELGTTMLKLLHPTSAVCGMPLKAAEEFLLAKEGYDREFYSGYLGPVNIGGRTAQFVNLRCFKIEDNCITFFAGAGVTEDSNPEKEWEETELKMNTLLNVIKSI
ncbi:isochorismate synthase [Fulvivirga lutea]|uniref:isochorismate synthase n=1 Tax=Fulvivirga lutea TaxID=2810512 RepID=A0A974WET9_9BACT|nr:isochorismate synthase [Fulvivirga lutea]QSE96841.1 isochorismate synthase [Fulvivirga lutea]